MTIQVIKNKRYNGKYVAVKSVDDDTVVSSGDHIQEVYKKAAKKGYKAPWIVYVPKKNIVQIYNQQES
jgi:hypothetical protein